MPRSSSFLGRIMLAIALMVGFYILAIVLAGTLILVPIVVMMFGRFSSELAVLMIISGCLILWSVLPSWDRFFPPGPRLNLANGSPPTILRCGECLLLHEQL